MRSRRSGTVARQASPIHESRPVTSGSSTSTRETFSVSSVGESRSATPPVILVYDDQPRPVTSALTRESPYSPSSIPRRVSSSISSIREARPGGSVASSIVSNREPRRVLSSVSSIREERSDGRVEVTSSGSISSIHEELLQHQAMDPPASHSPSSSTTHYFTGPSITTKPPKREVVEAAEDKRAFETEPEATRGSVTEDRAPISPSPLVQDSFAVGPAKTFSEPAEISRTPSPSSSTTRRSTVRGERKTDEERRLEAEKRERKLNMEARERRFEELERERKLSAEEWGRKIEAEERESKLEELERERRAGVEWAGNAPSVEEWSKIWAEERELKPSVEEWGRRIKGEERELRFSLEEAKRKLELKREHRAGVESAGKTSSAEEWSKIKAEERELELSVEEAVRKLEESIRERRARDEDERKVGGRETEGAARESTTENHTSISPWVQGISTSDAILSSPVGEYTPPVSNSSTAAEPQASTNEPDGQSHLGMITDPLRSSSTPIPRGFALQENLSTELLAQAPLQAEVPAPEHQVVPQVTVPNNTDASDRSRVSSIRVPPDEGDGHIIMPIPVNVGHPRGCFSPKYPWLRNW
ncbi:hypothetical protein BD779DRAFT_540865 [Infundibulicybe gibba]|nr:hypothetical protein BD779DRAFT_540865 [Infundibulicybe gibba]